MHPHGACSWGASASSLELAQALDDAHRGRRPYRAAPGEPGIGKTRLGEEFWAEHARAARTSLWGRCSEAGGAPAYWPWPQAMRGLGARELETTLRCSTRLGDGAGALSGAPARAGEVSRLPPPAGMLPGRRGRRRRASGCFGAVGSRCCGARQGRGVACLIVLDDLHAADESSLLLLRFMAREIAGSRLLVVGAFRDVDPTPRDPLSAALAELVREPHTAQIELSGLSEPDVAAYIGLSTATDPVPQMIQAVHTGTEGNPLFVSEVVRLLDAEGGLSAGNVDQRIPPGIRPVIGRRVGRLSPDCGRVLVLAAVLGREFGLDTLTQLADLPRDKLLDVLDEAMAERLVGEASGSPGRLRFGHALIRDTLYDGLTPARRLQLHLQAGEALEAVYAADLEPHLAELAHHFCAAAPAGGRDKGVDFARRGGVRAASQLAYEEAVRLYEMALALVDDDVVRCELLLALG